jgi:hypothetical protein
MKLIHNSRVSLSVKLFTVDQMFYHHTVDRSVVKEMLYGLISLSRRRDVHILVPFKDEVLWATATRLP